MQLNTIYRIIVLRSAASNDVLVKRDLREKNRTSNRRFIEPFDSVHSFVRHFYATYNETDAFPLDRLKNANCKSRLHRFRLVHSWISIRFSLENRVYARGIHSVDGTEREREIEATMVMGKRKLETQQSFWRKTRHVVKIRSCVLRMVYTPWKMRTWIDYSCQNRRTQTFCYNKQFNSLLAVIKFVLKKLLLNFTGDCDKSLLIIKSIFSDRMKLTLPQ